MCVYIYIYIYIHTNEGLAGFFTSSAIMKGGFRGECFGGRAERRTCTCSEA